MEYKLKIYDFFHGFPDMVNMFQAFTATQFCLIQIYVQFNFLFRIIAGYSTG